MMSTLHSLVNVYEQGGLGLGAPWSQQAAAPSWPILGGLAGLLQHWRPAHQRAGWVVSTVPGLRCLEGKPRLGSRKRLAAYEQAQGLGLMEK